MFPILLCPITWLVTACMLVSCSEEEPWLAGLLGITFVVLLALAPYPLLLTPMTGVPIGAGVGLGVRFYKSRRSRSRSTGRARLPRAQVIHTERTL